MKNGHSITVYACRKCCEIFHDLGQFFVHCREFHSEKKFQAKSLQCQQCSYSTDNGGLFKLHHRVHSGFKPEICDICKKGFTQRSNMKIHRKRHFKSTVEYCCEECDQTFGSHDIFLSHMSSKEHKLTFLINQASNVKVEYNCSLCNLVSSNIDEIMEHGESCNCSDNLVCQTCFLKLPLDKSVLRQHRKYHREQILVCWECVQSPQNFDSKSSLIQHLIKEHNIDFQRSHVCRYCQSIFETKQDLSTHVESEHDQIKYKHQPNLLIGQMECRYPDCEFFTNSFLQLEKHSKNIHGLIIDSSENLIMEPVEDISKQQRGRPRLCNTKIECSETSINLSAITCRKRGRPKKEEIKEEDTIPKKRGRPRKNPEILQN